MAPIFASLQPLDKVSHYTPLGIRFWDLARDAAVVDGLQVTIRPPGRPDLQRRAFQTRSGVFAFRNLPGLRNLEASDPDLAPGMHLVDASPLQTWRFVVDVEDRLGRFMATTFQVDLPQRGIYPTQPVGSPPGLGLPGFFLFSAPTRSILADMAVLRVHLVERLPGGGARAAAYAVLEIASSIAGGAPGSTLAMGIADAQGGALVAFPYPSFAASIGYPSSPPSPPETRVQAWDLFVQVRYSPATSQARPDSAARLPDLSAIVAQPPARILPAAVGPGQFQLNTRLVFGQPLTLRTAGSSSLWIEPQ
ncbi:MAG TPA: hypothetical protein VL334_07625 [Anaerolineae bacterium]|nr:hypothetical protein [Anaerolineae bacterium]